MAQLNPGVNDLTTVNPKLAAQWHPTLNGPLLPSGVTPGSNKKVWWRCSKCGHEWTAMIASRSRGTSCPPCGRAAIGAAKSAPTLGVNDLASQRPEVATQWHPTLNGDLLPNQVTLSSGKKAWWLCPDCGHEWATRISVRSKGHGCPHCARPKMGAANCAPMLGVNDLASQRPTLAASWHPSANGDLLPGHVTEFSNRRVWWLCPTCDHVWAATVASRSNGRGCPACASAHRGRPISGADLLTTYPEVAQQWHPTLNGALTPSQVTPRSHKRVWWLCPGCGHEWTAMIANRSRRTGCPECAIRSRRTA